MDSERGPDKLIMVLYLSKYYEMFHNSTQSNTGRAFLTIAPQYKTPNELSKKKNYFGCISIVLLLKSLKFVKCTKILGLNLKECYIPHAPQIYFNTLLKCTLCQIKCEDLNCHHLKNVDLHICYLTIFRCRLAL